MDDHFFNDLGGNSLLMARSAPRSGTARLSVGSMLEVYLHPTPREFASFLATRAHRIITRPERRAVSMSPAIWTIGCAAACN
jgi:hypothetical protein